MIERTERDVLRAYRVYKAEHVISTYIKDIDEDFNSYTVITAFVALYNGMTISELEKVLPISKNVLRDFVRKAVYKYGILDYNGSVVIGHRAFLDKGSRGVLSVSQRLQKDINEKTKELRVSRKLLRAFASLLSESSAHTIIIRDNAHSINQDSKGVLRYIHALWLALLGGNLYSGSTYAKELSNIGYMRAMNNGCVELNKDAIFYKSEEPNFELSTVCKNN